MSAGDEDRKAFNTAYPLPDYKPEDNKHDKFDAKSFVDHTKKYHYGAHHFTYYKKLFDTVGNQYSRDDIDDKQKLVELIKKNTGNPFIFNNGAQLWNHDFFWRCMKIGGGLNTHNSQPVVKAISQRWIELAKAKDPEKAKDLKDLDGLALFAQEFKDKAVGTFGSGWAWLVLEGKELKIVSTKDADTPLVHNQHPLLTVDVWEHAYYLDFQNKRPDFVEVFIHHLINWDFVQSNFPSNL